MFKFIEKLCWWALYGCKLPRDADDRFSCMVIELTSRLSDDKTSPLADRCHASYEMSAFLKQSADAMWRKDDATTKPRN